MCGTAIRLAQDVGAHKRKSYEAKPTPEDELWKRAFWYEKAVDGRRLMLTLNRVLVLMDRWLSAQLGRACSIQDEE